MIDFENELKKFHPSPEIDAVEDVVNNHDLADMVDFVIKTVSEEDE